MTTATPIFMLLVGLLAGFCSGIFGIGGGVIIVPILVLLFGFAQTAATGTSLVALLLPVGILGALEYYKLGKLSPANIKFGLLIALGMFLGTYAGARFGISLPEKLLQKSFSMFLILIAIRLWTF